MMINSTFQADIRTDAITMQGTFPIDFESKLKEHLLTEFKKDKRFNHSAISNPSVTRIHLSKRGFENDSILVGDVCIGNGNYINYTIPGININIGIKG